MARSISFDGPLARPDTPAMTAIAPNEAPLPPAPRPERHLKIGLQLPEAEREVRWSELLELARAAEDLGYDSLWVGDHLLYRDADGTNRGPWEAWSLLAALAAVTHRVELGPLVAATSFREPALLAKEAATIDEISGGRLILGLGAGWNEVEYRAYGFPYDHRVSRFAEAFTIIRTLLREGAIDVAGDFYTARDCVLVPRGPRPEGPPLMVGSIGARMLAITAPHVQAWNAWHDWFGNTPEGLVPILGQVDAAVAAAGREPASVERTATVLVRLPGGTTRYRDPSSGREAPPVAGSPEEIAERLLAYAALGVSHLQLVLEPIDRASIEALAPALELARQD
ncbi:MAG: LLM class flavin-dependent oxidoreductase [Chloroflexota bacterium]|nr:MAG: LLM class flavin-dependent oxidoreductase [Chloroflexota bacterium]